MINDICSSSRNACLSPLSTSSTLLGGKRCGTDETINTSLLARPALRRRGFAGATVVLDDFIPRPLLLNVHKFSARDGKFLMRRHRGRFPCSHGIGIRATSESGSLGCSWLETDGLQVVVRAGLGQIEWRFPNTRPFEKE